jgi:pyrimidine-nucleoside phosphorylase/thymidine phosphorylase
MNVPLGRAVGNSLEVIECLETLKGAGPADVVDVIIRLGTRMVRLAGVESDVAAAEQVRDALASGRGLQTFARMIEQQGGNPSIVDDSALLPVAPGRALARAPRSGILVAMYAGAIGRASSMLGAGRTRVDDAVDHGVGVVVLAKPGDAVAAGDPLVELYHRDGRGLDAALALCAEAIVIGDVPPTPRPAVLAEVR